MRRPNSWTSSKRQTGCSSTECRQRRILLRNLPRSWPQPVGIFGHHLDPPFTPILHLLDDTQAFIQIGAQLLTKTWQGKRPGVSS
jgi:hypothetical protein